MGVLSTLLGVFASLGILSERGIARLLRKHKRQQNDKRGVGGLSRVDACESFALGDKCGGALVGNNLKIIGSTGV